MVAETYGAFDSALGPKFVFSSLVLKWESEPVSPRPGRHPRELVGRPSSSRFEGRGARGGLVFFLGVRGLPFGRPALSAPRFEGRGPGHGQVVSFERRPRVPRTAGPSSRFEEVWSLTVFRSAGRLSPPRGSRAQVPAVVEL